jgi:molecular chaperone DnaK
LKENREAISEAEAASLEEALSKAKNTLESSTDASELNAAFEELTQSSHRLAEAMYQKTAGQAQQQGEPGSATEASEAPGDQKQGDNKEDEVIDAEYVDMDKDE